MGRIIGTIQLDALSVLDGHIGATNIDADKLQHIYKAGTEFDTQITGTPTTQERIVFVASTSGTIRAFSALLNESGTNTNITFDLKKNGVTVLSSTINLVHGDGDRTIEDGTINLPAFVAGDVFSISMTATLATGAQGAYAWGEFEEGPP